MNTHPASPDSFFVLDGVLSMELEGKEYRIVAQQGIEIPPGSNLRNNNGMKKMKIYTYPKSRSLRVLWALEEMGAEYEPIRVDLESDSFVDCRQ